MVDKKMCTGLVSVIIPTFNVADYIEETLKSVLCQTFTNFEVIIIDDCSSDETPCILKLLSENDKRVNVIFSGQNRGSGANRNLGLSVAKGQYIAFLDSDDIWDCRKLELQLLHIKKVQAPICHTSFQFIDHCGNSRSGFVRAHPCVDLEWNLRKTEIGTSTVLIDRFTLKDDFQFSGLRARQDLELWVNLLGKGYHSSGLDIPLVKYRIRSGSISSNKFKMLFITFKVYLAVLSLPLSKRLICYFSYVFNAIRKRNL